VTRGWYSMRPDLMYLPSHTRVTAGRRSVELRVCIIIF